MRHVTLVQGTPAARDTLSMYAPGERDLLVMYHEVEAEFPHGKEVYERAHMLTHARASDALQLLLHHVVLWRSSRRYRNGPHGEQPPVASLTPRFTRHT